MKERICENGWFRVFFVDYPIGFVIVLVLVVAFFIEVSKKTQIPVYETSTTVICEDANGYYIRLPEGLNTISAPFYIYQLRNQYVERVEDYTVDAENGVIYLKKTAFTVRDEVYIDIESKKISLLDYFLNE